MSDDPRYRQLADDLECAIAAGRLVPGTRLPSIREFRETHHISVTTAVQAYRTLEEQGLVDARQKSGYFVAPRRAALRVPALRTFIDAPKRVEVHTLFLEVQRKLATPGLISLSSSLPDPRFFPTKGCSACLRRSCADIRCCLAFTRRGRGSNGCVSICRVAWASMAALSIPRKS